MAISIPASLVRLSRNINMTLDASLLGPNQRRTYERAAKSGAFAGAAPPFLMAEAARKAAGLPTIRIGQYGYITWSGSPFNDEAVYKVFIGMLGELNLLNTSTHAWHSDALGHMLDAVQARAPHGKQWLGYDRRPIVAKHLRRITTLPELAIVPELIAVDLIDEKVPS